MTQENRNLILAVVLSALVLFGWTFASERLFPAPKTPPAATATAAAGGGPVLPGAAANVPVVAPSADTLAAVGARVRIETPRLEGSINLTGARFDDLVLKDHLVSLPPSKPIRLFSPSGSKDAYFAGYGWVGPGAPPADAEWTANAATLSVGKPVTLSWRSPQGLIFQQIVSVDANFLFTVEQRVANASAAPVSLRAFGYVNRTGRGPDKNGINLHVGPIAVLDGKLLEGDIDYDKLRDKGPQTINSKGGWLGITDKHWLAALIPDQQAAIEARFTAADAERYQVDWLKAPATVNTGEAAITTSHLFAGAKEVRLLNQVRDELGVPLFDRALAWGWFWFIAQPIFGLLAWLYGHLGNYALAIVGLTLIVRAVLFPIANKQYASMAKMRIFAPKMKEIQEKYKDDKQKQQFELMELYKKEKINPLAGCLPILLQIPIFYALYKTLLITVEMRHQPAFLWIKDLAAPDPLTPLNLFGLLPFDLPPFLHLGILPIILGVTMWAQFKLNPQPMDEIQAKVFAFMPWIFMFMMAPFAAGLQIYWIVNNLVSILQQWILLKKYPAPAPAPAATK
ncbi:membrane protein insertase YidC [Sandaracinobacter neustonicus]|uniref:Membrane protein insertase YidC n=1 Tax=Sandaracinobacter neustonicus TaxID=1715348 RepID=A0A501XEF8_9SPHN|nr:membrane protein insertase YidC [Sandaracinobacter neustonicus]TPE58684.1 membrane protein insertase YidC [Sandaracinobacter neustonicus]